jgi:hypothetical protein
MTQLSDRNTPLLVPGEAVAEAGQVLLDGPDGVAIALSPDAAEETGRRLIAAAAEARRQPTGGSEDLFTGEGSA